MDWLRVAAGGGLKATNWAVENGVKAAQNTDWQGIAATAAASGQKATNWAVENPGKAAAFGVGAAMVVVPMAVAGPALGAVGFGANGIVLGSAATVVQSNIGNVVAPSLFSTLQSAAAGGYGVAAVSSAAQWCGGLVFASTGAMSARSGGITGR
ncbi:hypothetical protein GGR50DRAFT_657394 [Xylaria sp. CBS 124048]|nr:hypothetical protein GGR50DRAFT_657394 [Xylaria sp. CBS 124048]